MTYLKNFMKLFGIYNEDVFINSLNQAKMQGSLGISYINAIIKLSQKKTQWQGYIKIYRTISLLNVDTKTLSKASAAKRKPI